MTARHNLWLILPTLLLLLGFPLTAIAEPAEYIPAPEVPLVYALEQPKEVTIPDSVLCNCWAYVKSQYPSLPSTGEIFNNLSATGSVAVFHYEKVGLNHYAVVRGETDTHYLIEETNYERCKKGTRWIPKDYPSLVGFFHI